MTRRTTGTKPGRKIVATTGPKENVTHPTMSYVLDLGAPKGSKRVVAGSNELGFDVKVRRVVYENGQLTRDETFPSHYIAVGPTTVYGPGQTVPRPYIVIPANTN